MSERYLIVIEGDDKTNYSAYSPDLPGVVAKGKTRDECARQMREAIVSHVEGLQLSGEDVPPPSSTSSYVDV